MHFDHYTTPPSPNSHLRFIYPQRTQKRLWVHCRKRCEFKAFYPGFYAIFSIPLPPFKIFPFLNVLSPAAIPPNLWFQPQPSPLTTGFVIGTNINLSVRKYYWLHPGAIAAPSCRILSFITFCTLIVNVHLNLGIYFIYFF